VSTNIFDKENQLKKLEVTKKFPLIPLDIQLFAGNGGDGGEGGEGGQAGAAGGEQGGQAGSKEELKLTQEELDKKIEAESDRKLASALQKKQQEWEAQLQQKIEDARKESERLAKLSEKERKDEELKKREKDIADRLAELERKELKADAIADLTEKELPSTFADFLLADNAENTLKNINAFKEAFDKAVNEAVKVKLRQDTPPGGGGTPGKNVNSFAELRNKQDRKQNKAPDLWAN